jgi:hypothetical protein
LAIVFAPPTTVSSSAPIAFIPLDDRPVTLQAPIMLGEIAGRRLLVPPRRMLGHYLLPGEPEALLGWLRSPATQDAGAIVASLDMMVYGGLVASRTPEVAPYTALFRLRQLAALHRERPDTALDVFGTIMRLAPTGLPDPPVTSGYWATGGTVTALQAYANLHDPPQSSEEETAARDLRARIGDKALRAYMASRARNRDVDLFALQLGAQGSFGQVVLGQDDAGPVGLHVRDVAALTAQERRLLLGSRASIEPGADELGMVLLAARFAQDGGWVPTVRVRYSRPDAARINDPLEFAPIDVTISRLIDVAGAHRVDETSAAMADIDLFVKVRDTDAREERAFLDAIAEDTAHSMSVAVADLTFLGNPNPCKEQQRLTEELIASGVAGSIDAFASWNTTANTVGTSLAEAIAVGAGKRTHRYDATAHARFMLDRYIDDYAFHQFVRPVLNAELRGGGIDPTLLPPAAAGGTESRNRALLWPYALRLLKTIYPQFQDAGMVITLPWQRTFETQIDVELGS